ncbi:hypothetical protein EC973_001063 [Apophysomyces ossiformis]|uniref:Uncharacterized protein n=1 Tax=Apophysomyces ossiformis TaxID=679940 RepID=A0A8H7ESV3_9FUNG|nr:hypothetical protein EC973_001063 [Apophysomyces ossiformis]
MSSPQQRSKPGTAFEIRFCDNNIVQVFDLTKHPKDNQRQLLPNEYNEDDVLKGRLRFSKLGHPISVEQSAEARNSIERNHRDVDIINLSRQDKLGHAFNDLPLGTAMDVIPAVAKRQAKERKNELRQKREAEEAVKKAMDRKAKIEQARMNAKKAAVSSHKSSTIKQPKNPKHVSEIRVRVEDSLTTSETEAVRSLEIQSHGNKAGDATTEGGQEDETKEEAQVSVPSPDTQPLQDEAHLEENNSLSIRQPSVCATRSLSRYETSSLMVEQPSNDFYTPLPPPVRESRQAYSPKRTSFKQSVAVGPLENTTKTNDPKTVEDDVHDIKEKQTCCCIIS